MLHVPSIFMQIYAMNYPRKCVNADLISRIGKVIEPGDHINVFTYLK